jgi:mRNA-degrading endonuclease RelE of RelBE toxin-antitoxin system
MEFRISDTFTSALAKLARDDQKAVKTTAFDLQMNPAAPGLKLHRIDGSRDANFWSVRVNRDVRIVIHKTAASFLLAAVPATF